MSVHAPSTVAAPRRAPIPRLQRLTRIDGEHPKPRTPSFPLPTVTRAKPGLCAAVPTNAGRKRPRNATMPMDDSTTSPLHCSLRHPWPHLRGRVRNNHRRPSPDPIPAFDAGFTPELPHSRTHTRTHIHGLAKPTGPWCQEYTGSAATLNALTAMTFIRVAAMLAGAAACLRHGWVPPCLMLIAGKPRDYLVATLDVTPRVFKY